MLGRAEEVGEMVQEVFSLVDKRVGKVTARLEHVFKPHDPQFSVRHLFEPAWAGLALAISALVYDLIKGNPRAPTLDLLTSLVGSNEQGLALAIGMLAISLSAVLVGSEFVRPLRIAIAAPLLKLVHHLVMVGFGIFVVIGIRHLWLFAKPVDFPVSALLAFYTLLLGFVTMGLGYYVTSDFLSEMEKVKTYRWVSIAAGIWIFLSAQNDLSVAVERFAAEHEACEASKAAKAAAPASHIASATSVAASSASSAVSAATSASMQATARASDSNANKGIQKHE